VCRVDFSSIGLLSFSSALTVATISLPVHFVRQVDFKYDIWPPLFEPGARFVVVVVSFYQCRLSRPLGHQSVMPRNLSTNVLIDSPFFCFVARRVGTDVSVLSSKKQASNNFS